MTALSRSHARSAVTCPMCGSAKESAAPPNLEADTTSLVTAASPQADCRVCRLTAVTAVFLGGFSLAVFFSAIAQFSVEGTVSPPAAVLPDAVRQQGQSLLP